MKPKSPYSYPTRSRFSAAVRAVLCVLFEAVSWLMLLAFGGAVLCFLACCGALLFPGAIRATEDGGFTAAGGAYIWAAVAFLAFWLFRVCRDLSEYLGE